VNGLDGKRIGVAADRSADTISTLVRKKGGTPVVYSIQGKQQLNEQTSTKNVKDFLAKHFDWAIFTTGVGANTLAVSSVNAGLHSQYIKKLNHTNLAIRGRKTLEWMKKNSLQASRVSQDGTMEDLLEVFADEHPYSRKRHVFLQAYNQDDAKLKHALEKTGCSVYLSKPYSYQRPNPQVVSRLKTAIIDQLLDAVVFTSKTQVQNIFTDQADIQKLVRSFNDQVLAVAVGKVTANELESKGVVNVLQPNHPKMGAMVVEIDRYYRQMNT
jgi:uroporphyrinogen-III synthase